MRLVAANSIGWVVSAMLRDGRRVLEPAILQARRRTWKRDPMATGDPYSSHHITGLIESRSLLLASRWRISDFCHMHKSDELVLRSYMQRTRLLDAWGLHDESIN
jgi:hypothetical protein